MPQNDEIQLYSNDSDACSHVEWLEALSPLGLQIHAPVHLLTYLLTQNNQCIWRLACDLVSWLFSEWFVFPSTAFGSLGPKIINVYYMDGTLLRFALLLHARGVATGWISVFIPPKSAQVNFCPVKMTSERLFNSSIPPKKTFIPPKTNFWLRPCCTPLVSLVTCYRIYVLPSCPYILRWSFPDLEPYSLACV